MRRVRIAGPALRDIARLLRRSEEEFGGAARVRYRRLLDKALRELAQDPMRIGVRRIDDVREGCFTYHLRSASQGSAAKAVRHPRHLIAFRLDASGDVIVARVFHEQQMLARHLADAP